ncbi:hypothetical protein FOZ63_002231 [Perkinsus olseni]|uniref:Uncharacterized protein n=1 Tax=Perkinsus olseni TaxID=32597 RepID=A0A7J6PYR7_PEROL|nr:hypothetical protein FOZ63_002231 [Perkinsus olseni]KAF4700851.1 hypothetical protein FOZ62_021450 [Perkinsus olseni]
MRLITFAIIIGCAVAPPKPHKSTKKHEAKRKQPSHVGSSIVVPTEFKEYRVQETGPTCRISVAVTLESSRRIYDVQLRKQGDMGLRVQLARCGLSILSPSDGRAVTAKMIMKGEKSQKTAKSGDLLERLSTVPGGLDGQDCNSRLSRVHRALARRSRKYKLLVDAVGAPLPSAFTSEEQSFFGTSGEEEPRTAYALVKSVCDYLVWEPLLDEDL